MVLGMSQPTKHEKKLLVHYKKFKTIEEIPDLVSSEAINKVRRLYKLKILTYLTAGAFVFSMAYAKGSQYFRLQQLEKMKRDSEEESRLGRLGISSGPK